jgi:hypothetical protein
MRLMASEILITFRNQSVEFNILLTNSANSSLLSFFSPHLQPVSSQEAGR